MTLKKFLELHGDDAHNVMKHLFEEHGTQIAVSKHLGVSNSALSMWLVKMRLKVVTEIKSYVIDEGVKAS